ncbi:MAG: peptidoglycan-binding domain-containing protein [Pyrinomonadaceae bacterium]
MPIPGAQSLRESVTEDPETDTTPQPDKPRVGVPYIIEIDGKTISGQTDADGRIEQSIPPNARQGRLILDPGTLNEVELPLNLGHLNPLTDASGVADASGAKHRLANLGFDCGDRSDETTPELTAALRAFQEKHGLQVTGEVDQATRDEIYQLHGS